MPSFRTMEFVDAADSIETELELVQAFERLLKELGISQYFLGEVSGVLPETVLRCGNWNEEWVARYIERDYHYADAVVAKAKSTPNAFDWEAVRQEGLLKGPSKRVMDEAGEFGIRSGYTVPVFQANGYLAVASFEADVDIPADRMRAALQLATVYFHARLLAFRDTALPCDAQLTPRQRECLHWVGVGKSDWEIGEILNIAEATVHSHVENAKRLYKVPTRIQAFVEAVRHHELRL
ncbi:MAG: LuxR family transcriptional regulator [Parvibaculaceae bacterium]